MKKVQLKDGRVAVRYPAKEGGFFSIFRSLWPVGRKQYEARVESGTGQDYMPLPEKLTRKEAAALYKKTAAAPKPRGFEDMLNDI